MGAPISKLGEKGSHQLGLVFVELVGVQQGHCLACLPKGGKATPTKNISRELYCSCIEGLQWDIPMYASYIDRYPI